MKNLFVFLCSLILLGSGTAFAIPFLSVAPGAPGSGGSYYGPEPPLTGDDSYQWVFADNYVGYLNGGTDAFQLPDSGGQFSILFGGDNPLSSTGKDLEIWLAADTAGPYGDGFAFDGVDFGLHNELSKASYQDPIYALKLGSINNQNDPWNWQRLTMGEFVTGEKSFGF